MTFNITLTRVAALLAALILLQSLYFKFSAHPDSVFIFTTLGMEPFGRIGIGIGEIIAALLLIIPRTSGIGALLGLGLMSGAIFFHLTKLGIAVNGDGGKLFALGIAVFICCVYVAWKERKNIPVVKQWV